MKTKVYSNLAQFLDDNIEIVNFCDSLISHNRYVDDRIDSINRYLRDVVFVRPSSCKTVGTWRVYKGSPCFQVSSTSTRCRYATCILFSRFDIVKM